MIWRGGNGLFRIFKSYGLGPKVSARGHLLVPEGQPAGEGAAGEGADEGREEGGQGALCLCLHVSSVPIRYSVSVVDEGE